MTGSKREDEDAYNKKVQEEWIKEETKQREDDIQSSRRHNQHFLDSLRESYTRGNESKN